MEFAVSGIAKVHCVHDRRKREVRDPEYVKYLGEAAGHTYDPRKHKLHLCACCENLFVARDDTPALCSVCSGESVHTLRAPLPSPIGAL